MNAILFNQVRLNLTHDAMNYISPSFAHGDQHVTETVETTRASLSVVARALEDGCDNLLIGPAIKPVFQPYN